MIHYQLKCGQDHGFDGWFKDSASFERQAKRGLDRMPRMRRHRHRARADGAGAGEAGGFAGPGRGAAPPRPRRRPRRRRKSRRAGCRRRCWRCCSASGPRWRRTATMSARISPTRRGRCIAARSSPRASTGKPPTNRRKAWPRKVSGRQDPVGAARRRLVRVAYRALRLPSGFPLPRDWPEAGRRSAWMCGCPLVRALR